VDLIVEQEMFICGVNLEEAIGSYFVAHLVYPKGFGVLCTVLQLIVAKLDVNGTKSALTGKDLRPKSDKGRCFTRAFTVYVDRNEEGRN
jgi:hypothetical protein